MLSNEFHMKFSVLLTVLNSVCNTYSIGTYVLVHEQNVVNNFLEGQGLEIDKHLIIM